MLPSISSLLLRKVLRIGASGLSTSIKNTSEHCKAIRISIIIPANRTMTASPVIGAEFANSDRAKASRIPPGKTAGIIYSIRSR